MYDDVYTQFLQIGPPFKEAIQTYIHTIHYDHYHKKRMYTCVLFISKWLL